MCINLHQFARGPHGGSVANQAILSSFARILHMSSVISQQTKQINEILLSSGNGDLPGILNNEKTLLCLISLVLGGFDSSCEIQNCKIVDLINPKPMP